MTIRPNHATGLQLRAWRAELAEKSIVRDHLDAEIEAYTGPRGPEKNRLVEAYIITRGRCEDLQRDIDRVEGRRPITGGKRE